MTVALSRNGFEPRPPGDRGVLRPIVAVFLGVCLARGCALLTVDLAYPIGILEGSPNFLFLTNSLGLHGLLAACAALVRADPRRFRPLLLVIGAGHAILARCLIALLAVGRAQDRLI